MMGLFSFSIKLLLTRYSYNTIVNFCFYTYLPKLFQFTLNHLSVFFISNIVH